MSARVRVITTGGTIASRRRHEGAVSVAVSGRDLVGTAPAGVTVEIDEVMLVHSFNLTLDGVRRIAERVCAAVTLLLTSILAESPLRSESKGEKPVDPTTGTALRVLPKTIRVDGVNRRQQLLITLENRSGKLVDVTAHCDLALRHSGVAQTVGSVVTGVSDGKTELRVRYGLAEVVVPVTVVGFNRAPPIHFQNDIVPRGRSLRSANLFDIVR